MNVLILGASGRAAAASARRAGLVPQVVDLFADRDTAALALTRRIDAAAFPSGLADLAGEAPPGPWIYTGGLENHPALIDRIARSRPLWGVSGRALRTVRDPFAVHEALRRAGLAGPEVRDRADGLPRDGSWLLKPRAGSGGAGVRPLDPTAEPDPLRHYLQRRVEGTSLGVLALARGGEATLLGVTRQRLGRPDHPYAYAGSLGPWPLPAEVRRRVRRIAGVLASAFELRGLFGIDVVLQGGEPWPVEVNPRYTASAEILELATGRAFLADHARAFGAGVEGPPGAAGRRGWVGKAILYAARPCRFPDAIAWRPEAGSPFEWRAIADVPRPGEKFEPGQPVLTVFARAAEADSCERRLARALARWEARLLPA
jgi:predicted ATP-grasp superfamily ATP-dependent carboligase